MQHRRQLNQVADGWVLPASGGYTTLPVTMSTMKARRSKRGGRTPSLPLLILPSPYRGQEFRQPGLRYGSASGSVFCAIFHMRQHNNNNAGLRYAGAVFDFSFRTGRASLRNQAFPPKSNRMVLHFEGMPATFAKCGWVLFLLSVVALSLSPWTGAVEQRNNSLRGKCHPSGRNRVRSENMADGESVRQEPMG